MMHMMSIRRQDFIIQIYYSMQMMCVYEKVTRTMSMYHNSKIKQLNNKNLQKIAGKTLAPAKLRDNATKIDPHCQDKFREWDREILQEELS